MSETIQRYQAIKRHPIGRKGRVMEKLMALTEAEKNVAWKAYIQVDQDNVESVYAAVLAVIAMRPGAPADANAEKPKVEPAKMNEVEWLETNIQ